jgi:hypothetical protein
MVRLVGLFIVFGCLFTTPEEKAKSEIIFCQFDLPEVIKNGNASFNVIYKFTIGTDGRPNEIVKISDNYVGEDKVLPCLQKWRFHGLNKEGDVVVIFRWEHAKGWVELSIDGRGFSQKISLEGKKCPYQEVKN